MKMPRMSWRPTTGQLTTAAIAVMFLLVGFWIGWQHRSSTDPATITPSVPHGMRTKAVIIVPPAVTTTGTGTQTTRTTTTAGTSPTALLPPRSQVKVTVLNAGGTAGAAVQVAVALVRLGYPTPVTGNVSLPQSLVPSAAPTAPPPVTTPTRAGTSHSTSSTTPAATSSGTTSTGTAALPMVVYYRVGDQALATRLAGDLGTTGTAPMPISAVVQAAAPSAQLIVIIGA